MALGDAYRGWIPPIWDDQQAGRQDNALPPVGVDFGAGLDFITRRVQAMSEHRRRLEWAGSVDHSASEVLRDLLRDEISPALRAVGMKGSGGKYRVERGARWGAVEIQKHSGGSRAICEFTFNLSAGELSEVDRRFDGWSARIGEVLPSGGDTWWVLPAQADTELLKQDLLRALRDHAYAALEAALEVRAEATEPVRRWSAGASGDSWRAFGPEAIIRAVSTRQQPAGWRENPGYEALLREAATLDFSGDDHHSRREVLSMLLDAAPSGDARCFDVLTAYLNYEPQPASRSTAAFALALLKMDPAPRLEQLNAAAQHDCDRSVRRSAGYASKLIETEIPND